MKIRIALCQLMPVPGRPADNRDRIMSCLESGAADVYVFPELFLTGYGADCVSLKDDTEACLEEISEACRRTDTAAAFGSPHYRDGRVFNGLAFFSPDGDTWYDKSHLAKFGIYAEDMFAEGGSPASGRYHGIEFGLCVCYDIFFPEILHGCSLRGSSVNICIAASAVPSKPFLDRVIPARALEDVTYLAYVNNTGPLNGLEMHGCSRGLGPLGDVLTECGTSECIKVFTADTEELESARSVRGHLGDFRGDVDWLSGGRKTP